MNAETPCNIIVPKLDGSSEIGAHVRSNLCYLICLRALERSTAFTEVIFSSEKKIFFSSACATYSEIPSSISTMFSVNEEDKIYSEEAFVPNLR